MLGVKICALETHSGGEARTAAVDYWRIVNPLKHTKLDVDFKKSLIDPKDNKSIEKSWVDVGKKYDILYSSYIDSAKPYAYLRAIEEKYGLIHVMDLDDNIYEVDEMSPAALAYSKGSETLLQSAVIVNDVEYVTVTTKNLKDTLERYGRKKPTFVMPNYIDAKLWEMPKPKERDDNKVNIIYQGSSTHFSDITNTGFLEACLRIYDTYGNKVHFYFMGMPPIGFVERFPRGRVDYIKGERDYYDFVKVWKEKRHKFDIGVAPLLQSSFNDCKSEIKYYEGAMSYLPMVLSKAPNYLKVATNDVNGFLVDNTPQAWFDRLQRLVDSHRLRKTMGEMAHKNVLDNYTIDKKAYLWEELLKEIGGVKS